MKRFTSRNKDGKNRNPESQPSAPAAAPSSSTASTSSSASAKKSQKAPKAPKPPKQKSPEYRILEEYIASTRAQRGPSPVVVDSPFAFTHASSSPSSSPSSSFYAPPAGRRTQAQQTSPFPYYSHGFAEYQRRTTTTPGGQRTYSTGQSAPAPGPTPTPGQSTSDGELTGAENDNSEVKRECVRIKQIRRTYPGISEERRRVLEGLAALVIYANSTLTDILRSSSGSIGSAGGGGAGGGSGGNATFSLEEVRKVAVDERIPVGVLKKCESCFKAYAGAGIVKEPLRALETIKKSGRAYKN